MDSIKPNQKIFLSYSWLNKSIVDEIDKDFLSIGITLQRDIRDLDYRHSIKEFMQSIKKSDFVIMLISDEYLRSEKCMYEVTELLNSHEFEKRVLPLILENATSIFQAHNRSNFYSYWQEKLIGAQKELEKHQNIDTLQHVKQLEDIKNHLDLFFIKLIDLNMLAVDEVQNRSYSDGIAKKM
jgi:hypothetical protein